ncbi:hypothetical protein FC831_19280 [Clostridium botulinum]|nr:hypothetical protein CIT17_18240 [Clostridium botulinum]MBY6988529.1 hypothetical protein [Clostridium botulinum]NFH02362.1 hypothetical protein [Clostridium botulinum]NFP41225.1 hypothetical protein [Clostridium botulinum]
MKRNKLVKICSVFLLAGTLLSVVPATPAHAQVGPTGTSSKYFKIQPITVKFSHNDCVSIAKSYKQIGKASTISAALAGKNPFASAALVAYGYNMSEMGDKFQKAADTGKGLKISYDYYISNTSYSLNEYRNVKVSYY